jgi:cyclic pyranopterin monophosphate synthase
MKKHLATNGSARMLTHLDARGRARMVDVGDKAITAREAIARGEVKMEPATLRRVVSGRTKKGDVLAVARVAGILAAKRTHELIPLCHPLPIQSIALEIEPSRTRSTIEVEARVRVEAKTGVEMEALTAVAVACLTIYDMVKAIDRGMTIGGIRLVRKSGGKSGTWTRGRRA